MNPLWSATPRVLIAGYGDIGTRVARRLRGTGVAVTAMLRDARRAAEIEADGTAVLRADLDRPQDVGDWPALFWFAPPRAEGDRDQRLRDWLAAQRGRIERLVYISTSGVYGDCDGRWIDESAPIAPRTPRARRRVDAESALAEWAARSGSAVVVLRVPGIYGPGRLPVARLQQQLPMLRAADSPWSNRIHSEDLADAAVLAMLNGRPGAAYHIADGHPTTMADYFTRCAELLGLPPPAQLPPDEARRALSPAMWSFMEESKRLRIDRARSELGFVPRYPDLTSGLPGCLER